MKRRGGIIQNQPVIVVAFAEPPEEFQFVANGGVWTRPTSRGKAVALGQALRMLGMHGAIKTLGHRNRARGKAARQLAALDMQIRGMLRRAKLADQARERHLEAIRQAELLVAQKAAREAQAQPEAKRPTYFRLPLAERIAREHEALRKGEDAIVAAWIKARAPTHGAA